MGLGLTILGTISTKWLNTLVKFLNETYFKTNIWLIKQLHIFSGASFSYKLLQKQVMIVIFQVGRQELLDFLSSCLCIWVYDHQKRHCDD